MENNILKIEIEKFSYNKDELALRDIDLTVKKGEFIILTGLSGCGKSTLIRIINGLIPDLYEGDLVGKISFLGKDLNEYRKGELAKYMGNVFQDPKDQFISTFVEDEIVFIGENFGLSKKDLGRRSDKVIDDLQLDSLRHRNIQELSGGEKQKVAVAANLLMDTELLILDEPSASLDYNSTLMLMNLLKDLKEQGKTIIIAEHRLFYLKDLCDRLIIMKDKTLYQEFKKDELTEEIRLENNLRCFDESKLVSKNKTVSKTEVEKVENLNVSINNFNKTPIVKDANFTLKDGEIMAIMGANGVGKTTLSKYLCGLSNTGTGFVSWGSNPNEKNENTFYIMQDVDSQIFMDSLENEIVLDNKDPRYLEEAAVALKKMDLWEKRFDRPQELSSGEKQRLVIATALIQNKRIIILDEPTAGLDYKRMKEVADLMKEASKDCPIIVVTHDAELVYEVCETVLLMTREKIEKVRVNGNEDKINEFNKA